MKAPNPNEQVHFGNYTAFDERFENELADVISQRRRQGRTVKLEGLFREEEEDTDE